MSEKKRVDLANQIDQSRRVKQLEAENSRLRAKLQRVRDFVDRIAGPEEP